MAAVGRLVKNRKETGRKVKHYTNQYKKKNGKTKKILSKTI